MKLQTYMFVLVFILVNWLFRIKTSFSKSNPPNPKFYMIIILIYPTPSFINHKHMKINSLDSKYKRNTYQYDTQNLIHRVVQSCLATTFSIFRIEGPTLINWLNYQSQAQIASSTWSSVDSSAEKFLNSFLLHKPWTLRAYLKHRT